MEYYRGKTRFEIDLKDSSLEFLQRVIQEVERFDVVTDTELTTAHYPLLMQAKKINPYIRTGTFFNEPPEWMPIRIVQKHILDWAEMLGIDVVHLNIVLIEPGFVDKLHQRRLTVYGSNFDAEEQIQKGFELGVNSFSTGRLELAVRLRSKHLAKIS